jgi:hypothetical protein
LSTGVHTRSALYHLTNFIENERTALLLKSAELLEAFQLGTVPDSANAVVASTLQPPRVGYTHHVGAIFGADGTAVINKYVWNQTSDFAASIAESAPMERYLQEVIRARASEVTGAFGPNEYGIKLFNNWAINRGNIGFVGTENPDLKLSIGEADLTNASVTFEIERTLGDVGVRSYYVVRRAWFSGTLSDLYDFNLFATDVFDAACLQAGFGTLMTPWAFGGAGGIFRTEFNLLNNLAHVDVPVGDDANGIYP